jgi:hypothetical protein
MQVGHWLWRLIGVEVWLWLTVVLLFPHYIMMNHHDITTKMLKLRLGSRMLVIIWMTSFVPQQLKLQGGSADQFLLFSSLKLYGCLGILMCFLSS